MNYPWSTHQKISWVNHGYFTDISYRNQNMEFNIIITISSIKYAFIRYSKILHDYHASFTTFSQSYEVLMSAFHNIFIGRPHEIWIFHLYFICISLVKIPVVIWYYTVQSTYNCTHAWNFLRGTTRDCDAWYAALQRGPHKLYGMGHAYGISYYLPRVATVVINKPHVSSSSIHVRTM